MVDSLELGWHIKYLVGRNVYSLEIRLIRQEIGSQYGLLIRILVGVLRKRIPVRSTHYKIGWHIKNLIGGKVYSLEIRLGY